MVAIDAQLAKIGEDGVPEFMADDGIPQANDLDRITLDMVDAVRRLRAAPSV